MIAQRQMFVIALSWFVNRHRFDDDCFVIDDMLLMMMMDGQGRKKASPL